MATMYLPLNMQFVAAGDQEWLLNPEVSEIETWDSFNEKVQELCNYYFTYITVDGCDWVFGFFASYVFPVSLV